jgi:hypothetical protein
MRLVSIVLVAAVVAACEPNAQECHVALKDIRITPASPTVTVGGSLKLKAEYTWCVATKSEEVPATWQLRTAGDSVYLTVRTTGEVTGRVPQAGVIVDYFFPGDRSPRGYVQVTVR